MKTTTLKELIAKAKAGEKFNAKGYYDDTYEVNQNHDYFSEVSSWYYKSVLARWTYEEIREPLKIEIDTYWVMASDGYVRPIGDQADVLQKQGVIGKKFKMVLTEIKSEGSDGN